MNITTQPVGTANFRYGRRGIGAVDMIVIHVTEGSAASARSWFAESRPNSPSSAHYMVTKAGEIDQFVDESDEAYHAGRVLTPIAPLVLENPTLNPNWYSIGIEHEGKGTEDLTPAQKAASAELIDDICQRHGIPVDRRHIVGHREVFAGKTCPGAINVEALVAAVVARRAPVVGTRPTAPKVVWSNYFKDWLIVTRVASDTDWSFVPVSKIPSGLTLRATAPLSAMERLTA